MAGSSPRCSSNQSNDCASLQPPTPSRRDTYDQHGIAALHEDWMYARMRNLKMNARLEDWAKGPKLPDGTARRRKPLDSMICHECKIAQDTKTHMLQVNVGLLLIELQAMFKYFLHQAMSMSVWIAMV